MNEDETQPIDRRIIEAAQRAKEQEEARKRAEEEALKRSIAKDEEKISAEEARAGISIPRGPSAIGYTAAASNSTPVASMPAQASAAPAVSARPWQRTAYPASYDPASAVNAADLQSRRDALPADRVFVREVSQPEPAPVHDFAQPVSAPVTAAETFDIADASDAEVQPENDNQGATGAPSAAADPVATAQFLDAFFAELEHCGVTDVVVSPGSRSTPLAMKAFERFGDVYMDVDERGAAFFALGLAKATGNPVAVICTSGTAVGNWMPAVLEAESSRVPLLLLSGDRPARLQHVGAPQTCDQLKLFGDHVKKFVQMPLPSADADALAYAKQIALDACIAAHGAMPGAISCDAGPVHINFPFEEPLKPAKRQADAPHIALPPTVVPGQGLMRRDAAGLFHIIRDKRVIALCGEGSCNSEGDAMVLLEFARKRNVPLLADPLSGLRSYDDPLVIDNYDTVFGEDEPPAADVVIRFGRWPVSKRCCKAVQAMDAVQIVVDVRDTRDLSSSTDLFVRCAPTVFAQAMLDAPTVGTAKAACAQEWTVRNDAAAMRIEKVRFADNADVFEGAYVNELIDMVPAESLLFCANSMAIRAVDTFYTRDDKPITVLCNRGLNGIDGTVSSAFGAAQAFEKSTLLIGDLAMLHDANALALQGEMRIREARGTAAMPSIVIVVLNNSGGAIFDMLPQKSDEGYFERLFLTPHSTDFKHLAAAFDVPYRRVGTVHDFRRVYAILSKEPGISMIDINLPLEGVKDRYAPYWH